MTKITLPILRPIIPPSTRSTLFLFAGIVFFVATASLHEMFSNGVVVPFKNWVGAGITEYVFLGISVVSIGGMVAMARRCIVFDRCTVLAWFVVLLLAVAATRWLMVTRIEMVHYPQYAVLAVLLRLGGLSPGSTYVAGMTGNFLDEGRQYFLHPRYTGYFDWNDILINALGLCMGLLLTQPAAISALRSRVALRIGSGLLALMGVVCGIGLLCGRVVLYWPSSLDGTPTAFPLVDGVRAAALSLKTPPLPFWNPGPWGEFHVMGVVEGFILAPLLMFLLYKGYVWCAKRS